MAQITTRQEFKNYCLRKLGAPVIEINIDDDQIEDRIDDALQYYQDYHFDGVQKIYYSKLLTQTDINQKYLDLSNVTDKANNKLEITGVTRIFPLGDSASNINMFDLRYQLRLNELYDFTSASYVSYTLTQQHLRSLEIMFSGEIPIRYQRHMKKLFIDWNWGNSQAPVGQAVVVEGYAIINPSDYNDVWNDRWLKQYATALIKRNWATNMSKFKDVVLPGGITLNGEKLMSEADTEITSLQEKMITDYSGPLEFYMN